jgi:hypothetical protein
MILIGLCLVRHVFRLAKDLEGDCQFRIVLEQLGEFTHDRWLRNVELAAPLLDREEDAPASFGVPTMEIPFDLKLHDFLDGLQMVAFTLGGLNARGLSTG